MRQLFTRLSAWRRRRQLEADLAEEMETHRLLKEAEHQRAGLSPQEAREAARRTMGNTTAMAEEARSVWIAPWLESLVQDLRYGLRGLRRNPSFALTAILSLGLAIGFNTSFFTVFNAVALRPWPVTEPDRVYLVSRLNPKIPGHRGFFGFGVVEARRLAESAQSIAGLVIQRPEQVETGDAWGRPKPALFVSGNYFRVLGAPMAAGRGFIATEDSTTNPQNVAVISQRLWTDHFGADPAAPGREIRINGKPFTIVGVADGSFSGTVAGTTDVFLPLSALPALADSEWSQGFLTNPKQCCATIAVRLAPGVTAAVVGAELSALHQRFEQDHALDPSLVHLERTAFMPASKRTKIGPVFLLFFLAVTFVLLLACANVANLTLARAVARQRELGIRLSIGASRPRLIRQLLTESLLIALAGSALGIAIAFWLPGVIFEFGIRERLALNLRPDWTVLAYTMAVAAAAAVISGLAPALHATRRDRTQLIQGTPAAVTGRFSLRGVTLGAQVTLSVILLTGTFLLLRGTARARSLDLGFQVDGIWQAQLMLPVNAYTPVQIDQMLTVLNDPWASSTFAVTSNPPLSFMSNSWGVVPPGSAPGTPPISVQYIECTPGYFDVLRIPVLRGRNFQPADRARNVLLINERLAARFWPTQNPIGQTLSLDKNSFEIIGVVRDAMTPGPGDVPVMMYRPFRGNMPFLLWKQGDGDAAAWQSRLDRVDPRIRLETMSLEQARSRWLRASEVAFWLAGGLGCFALVLTAIGIFGTFSFAVEQRRQEIGIRLSLGARTSQILRGILLSSGRAVLAGLALGLVAAAGLSRLLQAQLYGLSPLDPLSYALVLVVIAVAAALASWSPAIRVARVDPASSLRCD